MDLGSPYGGAPLIAPSRSGLVIFGMAVGPREGAMAVDTLNSLATYYPFAVPWILDDCTNDGTYEMLREWTDAHGGRLLRNATPHGYRGITRSYYRLLATIATDEPMVDMVIKIDPDTCLLAEGLIERFRDRFAAAGPGIVGAYRIGAGGHRRVWGHIRRNMLIDLLLPVGPHKTWRAVRVGAPFWARYIRAARLNGYVLGEHVLGALAAIHGDTLRALARAGYLSVPEDFRALTVQMDVLLGIGTRAVGHSLIDIDDEPPARSCVWLQFLPPIPLDAEALLERGFLAVHPVKGTSAGDAMRSVFRQRREERVADVAPASPSPLRPVGETPAPEAPAPQALAHGARTAPARE